VTSDAQGHEGDLERLAVAPLLSRCTRDFTAESAQSFCEIAGSKANVLPNYHQSELAFLRREYSFRRETYLIQFRLVMCYAHGGACGLRPSSTLTGIPPKECSRTPWAAPGRGHAAGVQAFCSSGCSFCSRCELTDSYLST
jgi:hypothetical protein